MTVRKNSSAMVFICLMGVVSLFADMTQEGARGIFGAYLGMMGHLRQWWDVYREPASS